MPTRRHLATLFVLALSALVVATLSPTASGAAPPYRNKPHLTCDPFKIFDGHHARCRLDHFRAHDSVTLTLHSVATVIGTAVTDASGSLSSVDVALPAGQKLGEHTITATGVGGSSDSATTVVQIVSATSGGHGSRSSRELALTGVQVVGLVVLGAALLGAGGLTTVAARRRRVSS